MTNKEIEEHVKFRMGKWYSCSPSEDVPKLIHRPVFKVNVDKYGEATMNRLPTHYRQTGFKRNGAITDLLKNANITDVEYFFDGGDVPYSNESPVGIFSHSRHVENDNGIIFPLNKYMGGFNHGVKDNVKWDDKESNNIFWRGTGGSGAIFLDGYYERYRRFVPELLAGKHTDMLDENNSYEYILDSTSVRHRFVKKWSNIYDVGFHIWDTHWNSILPYDSDKLFVKEFVGKIRACKYKYHLVLEGSDYATSLFWGLKSNILILMPPIHWNWFITKGLKAWEHYIPLNDDASDLEDKLEWCRLHDDECKLISKNATDYLLRFNLESETAITKRIFERLNELK